MPVHVIWYYPAPSAAADASGNNEEDYSRMNVAIGQICVDGLLLQQGVWLVRTPKSRPECLAYLSEFTGDDDSLIVCESSGVSYRSRIPALSGWLDERINPSAPSDEDDPGE